MADSIEVPFDLAAGESVIEVRDLEDERALVSDGNSRWEDHGDKRYFIVTEAYKAPETDAA